jgi:hypothetical protein
VSQSGLQQETVTRKYIGLDHLFAALHCRLRPKTNLNFTQRKPSIAKLVPLLPHQYLGTENECNPHDPRRGIIGLRRPSPRTPGGFGFDFEIRVKIISIANIGAQRSCVNHGRGVDHAWWGFEPNNPTPPNEDALGRRKTNAWNGRETRIREDLFLCLDLVDRALRINGT